MKKITVVLVLLTSFFLIAMSDDGNNDPTVVKKEVKSSETVKDQFGIDTGMTKEDLEKYKDEYLEFQKKCGIYAIDNLYYHKINLNAVDKLAEYDILLDRSKDLCTTNDFILKSEIIVIVSFMDFSIERNKKLTYPATFNVKVHEVIQNNTEYEKIPDMIKVKGTNFPNWKFDQYESGLSKTYKNKDDKYVLFLSRYGFIDFKRAFKDGRRKEIVDDTCFEPFTFAFVGYQRKIEDNEILFDENKYPPINISLDQFKKNVKEINQINDISNFYKRSYR
jgi:hypothetical protein